MDNIVQNILKKIKDNYDVELPDSGVVAGQSIAALYLEEIGSKIETRIKDIDLFVLKKERQSNPSDPYYSDSKYYINVEGNHKIILSDASYGSVSFTKQNSYTITNTKEVGMLNIVFIEHVDEKESLKTIVDSFDLNCVQIGIDLKTKEIYFTKEFLTFVKNGNIKIVNLNSPITSLARVVDKSLIFKNTTININENIDLVRKTLLIYEPKKNSKLDKIHLRGMFVTPERFEKYSEKSKSIIRELCNIENIEAKDYYNNKIFKLYKFNLRLDSFSDDEINKMIKLNLLINEKNIHAKYVLNESFLNNIFNTEYYENFIDLSLKLHLNNEKDFFEVLLLSNNNIFELNKEDVKLIFKYFYFTALSIKREYSLDNILKILKLYGRSQYNLFLFKSNLLSEYIDVFFQSESIETSLKNIKEIINYKYNQRIQEFQKVLKKPDSKYNGNFYIEKDFFQWIIYNLDNNNNNDYIGCKIYIENESNHFCTPYLDNDLLIFSFIKNDKKESFMYKYNGEIIKILNNNINISNVMPFKELRDFILSSSLYNNEEEELIDFSYRNIYLENSLLSSKIFYDFLYFHIFMMSKKRQG